MGGSVLEIVLAFFAMAWGVWLLLPFNTFASSATFSTMAALAPEEVWGFALLALGFVWMFGTWANLYRVRRWASLFSTGVWWFISVMFWIANLASTASATYPIIALACGLAHIRMRRGGQNAK